eukprot:GHRQ01028958.1.p2 GENE.GHRQ01028958.1~~GHRQ01028958.1.p2  ORF type:complete len:100 (+),score=1.78 GHRQ01028958.1:66-365(+)
MQVGHPPRTTAGKVAELPVVGSSQRVLFLDSMRLLNANHIFVCSQSESRVVCKARTGGLSYHRHSNNGPDGAVNKDSAVTPLLALLQGLLGTTQRWLAW